MAELTVVTGGTRSGKSAVAERLLDGRDDVTYVATARATDAEMRRRIARHRARRPPAWHTVEAGDLAAAVRDAAGGVLIDGLGLWLAAHLEQPDATLLQAMDELAAAARLHPHPVVVVAEQAGLGVVPADAGSRRWVDLLGESTQRLAVRADRVLLVVAGRACEMSPVASEQPEDDLRRHGDRMVPAGALDLAVNVYGDEPAPHVREAVSAAGLGCYPDEGAAVDAIAARHRRRPDEVLPTAGAADAFWTLAQALRPRRAAVVHPQFTEPEAALRATGAQVVRVMRLAEDDWRLDVEAVPADADLVAVGRPNNPSGTIDDADAVARLCRPGRVTLVDEAFVDFVVDEPVVTLAGRRDLPGLVVVRSVTKLWALAGVRAGYVVGDKAVVALCARTRRPWAVGAPALAALAVCARDEAYRLDVARRVERDRTALVAALRGVPKVEVAGGAANFVLMRVPDGPSVHAALLQRDIAVRPSTFPGLSSDHLRVAVRGADATSRLVAALSEVLA